jgi:hypothetical protein
VAVSNDPGKAWGCGPGDSDSPLRHDANIIETLASRGQLHLVGAVLEPVPVSAFALIMRESTLAHSFRVL